MSQASQKRILLVEDSDGLRRVYQKLLEAYAYQVLTAQHGAAALEVLENNNIDVVVSDIGMPVMDGFELARNLRAHPLYRNLRLIALTAYSQPTLVEEARRVGFDTYLAKPINMVDLCQAIEGGHVSTDHLRPAEVQHSSIPEEAASPLSSFRRQLRAAPQDLHVQLEHLAHDDLRLSSLERVKALDDEHSTRLESERLNRAKDDFVAKLSHELRTPLNAILGWTQLLQMSDQIDAAELAEGLEVIERNAKSQAATIENLLEISRVFSGRLRLDLQDENLVEIVEDALESLSAIAGKVRAQHLR